LTGLASLIGITSSLSGSSTVDLLIIFGISGHSISVLSPDSSTYSFIVGIIILVLLSVAPLFIGHLRQINFFFELKFQQVVAGIGKAGKQKVKLKRVPCVDDIALLYHTDVDKVGFF
jgi:hypothetical protein